MKYTRTLALFVLSLLSFTMGAEESGYLMGYKLSSTSCESYEEGRIGGSIVHIDSTKTCIAFYFNGAMMATPIYLRQIKDIEYVAHSDSSQINSKYHSKTGRISYGKSMDGTYFVEKLFYDNLQGVPQGIILFKIPEEYFEEVLQKLVSLPSVPLELLWRESFKSGKTTDLTEK